MTNLLEVRGLKKYFPVIKGFIFAKTVGWIKAVDDISFAVNNAETFALVGESGCGKTTTSKLILRLYEPTAGSILFDGKDVSRLKGKGLQDYRSSVQAVFQDPYASLDPRMKVGSILAEPMGMNKSRLPKQVIQERIAEVLAQVGLSPEATRLFPHEFSGGQRQRISLARSLIVRPKLIILDEPVSALDVSIQAQVMNLFKDLQIELGISYLLIAHNLATVRYMSHHIGVMYLGKLVEQGSTKAVHGNRLHPYTKALFSAALPFHPDMVQDEITLPGEVPSPLDPPSGCRFHPRCSFAMAVCSEIEPGLCEAAPDHWVACHLYYKVG